MAALAPPLLDFQKLLAYTHFSFIFIHFVLVEMFFCVCSASVNARIWLKMNAEEFIVQLCGAKRLLFIESKWNGIKFETAATTIFTFVGSISEMPEFAGDADEIKCGSCEGVEKPTFIRCALDSIWHTFLRRKISRMNGKNEKNIILYAYTAQCAHMYVFVHTQMSIQSVHIVILISSLVRFFLLNKMFGIQFYRSEWVVLRTKEN